MSDDIPLTYPRPVRTKFSVNENGPFVIGVAGGASSGKQKACSMIMDRLVADIQNLQNKVVIIRLTDFYKTLTPEQRILADRGDFNFGKQNFILIFFFSNIYMCVNIDFQIIVSI